LLESPPFIVPIKATPPKPLIILAKPDANGSGATACSNNPQDISGANTKTPIVAGQQIALIACINNLQQGFTIRSESWTAPSGTAVAGFNNGNPGSIRPDVNGGHPQTIQPVNCGTGTNCVFQPLPAPAPPVFYWVCPATGNSGACPYPGDAQITFNYQVTDGTTQQTVSATATFTVAGPTNVDVVTAMKAAIIHMQDGKLVLALGNFPTTEGINFPATGDPFPIGSGINASYTWVQIITEVESNFLFQDGTRTWDLCTTQQAPAGCTFTKRFIDTTYPYATVQDTDDSPAFGLPTFHDIPEGEGQESFSARMWLMWDPALLFHGVVCPIAHDPATASRCDSIPIPVGYVDWHFSGCGINTLDTVTVPTDTLGWRAGAPPGMPGCGNPDKALGGGDPALPPGPAFVHQAFVFPEWDTFASGATARQGPNWTCKGVGCPAPPPQPQ
jgi:hypothetical protein